MQFNNIDPKVFFVNSAIYRPCCFWCDGRRANFKFENFILPRTWGLRACQVGPLLNYQILNSLAGLYSFGFYQYFHLPLFIALLSFASLYPHFGSFHFLVLRFVLLCTNAHQKDAMPFIYFFVHLHLFSSTFCYLNPPREQSALLCCGNVAFSSTS